MDVPEPAKAYIAGFAAGFPVGARVFYSPVKFKIFPGYLAAYPHYGVFFLTYEQIKNRLIGEELTNRHYPVFLDHAVAAAAGELFGSFCSLPFHTILSEKEYVTRKSIVLTIKQIWQHHGFHGFYKSQVTRLVSDLPSAAIAFPLYESFKVYWTSRRPENTDTFYCHMSRAFVCGSAAGAIAGAVTTPFHTDERSIQKDLRQIGRLQEFKEFWTKLRKKTRFFQIFRGLSYRIASCGFVTSTVLCTYEGVRWTM